MAAHEVTPESDARWALQCAREEQLEAELRYSAAERALTDASRALRGALGRRLACEKKLRDLGCESF